MAFIKRSIVEQISIIKDEDLNKTSEELKEKFNKKQIESDQELKKVDEENKILN